MNNLIFKNMDRAIKIIKDNDNIFIFPYKQMEIISVLY